MASTTTTLRTTATTARTTGEDDDDSKDDDSKDDGDDGEDDNNDGGNDDRGGGGGGGGKIGGEVSGVARSVAVAWSLVAVFFAVGCLALTYHRNCTDMFGNKLILINSIRHVRTCQIEFILFVHIHGLFYVYSCINSGINRLLQFW